MMDYHRLFNFNYRKASFAHVITQEITIEAAPFTELQDITSLSDYIFHFWDSYSKETHCDPTIQGLEELKQI